MDGIPAGINAMFWRGWYFSAGGDACVPGQRLRFGLCFGAVVIIYAYECSCEGEGLAVGCEDGRVDVACGRQEDSDRYKGDAEDGCHGGDEELYFDIGAFHFSG